MPDEKKKYWKIWKAHRDSEAGIMVTPESVTIAGNRQNSVSVDNTGVFIGGGGNLSFNTLSEKIRQGGLFAQANDFVQMIPTTLVTPMPNLIPFPPLAMIQSMLATIPIFLAALG